MLPYMQDKWARLSPQMQAALLWGAGTFGVIWGFCVVVF